MRIDDQRRSSNVEDRRGQTVRGAGMGAALPLMALRLLFSRAGRRFLIPVALVVIAIAVWQPRLFQNLLVALFSGDATVSAERLPVEEEERLADFSRAVLGSTEDVWGALFAENTAVYEPPTLVLYTGAVETHCGLGQAASGPFYCPPDNKLYIDLLFFREMETKLGAQGDFAKAYVVAHEVGHHVQDLMGVLDWSQRQKAALGGGVEGNQIQVRVELMADCFAGVWAAKAGGLSAVMLEPGDIEEAVRAAEAVGDDTLQKSARGKVVPDAFTHGSAAQRMRWFETGYRSGDPDACETRDAAYERL